MNTQAIAQHLNLPEELITEIQEWAKVLWVRIKGMRPKFVSKKVVNMIDARIPKTLEEARAFTGVRFHFWNQDCREITQRLMNAGIDSDIITYAHPMWEEVHGLEKNQGGGRTPAVVARIAYKLTH